MTGIMFLADLTDDCFVNLLECMILDWDEKDDDPA